MKPTVPTVPLAVWKDLHSAAQKFHALRPWEMLDDTDLIAVHDASTGETGYGVVMGSGGTLFGFCLYRGAEGFHMYQRLLYGSLDIEEDDFFAVQNCLKIELGPRSDLQPEDHSVIRRLSLRYKGKHAWPEFRSLLPGYAPWFLTEAEARFLTLGLNIACHHHDRINSSDIYDSIRDGECFVYVPVDDARTTFAAQWEAWPTHDSQPQKPPVLNLSRINALRAKKTEPDTPWETDVFYLPSPVFDYERPYYVRVTVICQHSSGFIYQAEPAPPESSVHQLLADAICSSVETHGLIPESIFVKNADAANALTPLAKALGITIRRKKKLSAIRMLKEAMMDSLVYGHGGGRKRK